MAIFKCSNLRTISSPTFRYYFWGALTLPFYLLSDSPEPPIFSCPLQQWSRKRGPQEGDGDGSISLQQDQEAEDSTPHGGVRVVEALTTFSFGLSDSSPSRPFLLGTDFSWELRVYQWTTMRGIWEIHQLPHIFQMSLEVVPGSVWSRANLKNQEEISWNE